MTTANRQPEVTGVLSWFPLDLPLSQRVIALFVSKWIIGALRPLVQLKVPDLLSDGPRSVEDIAEATGTNADALFRVLRCTAAAGLLVEDSDGKFGLTPVAEGLREGVPGSVRDMFLFASDPMMWRPYEDVLHTVRTGEPKFDHEFGTSFFEYLKQNPDSNTTFNRAMLQNRYPGSDRILDDHDFGKYPRIADVGGGKGQFLVEVLKRHPACTGVLCDQPQVVAEAADVFEQAGVSDRVTLAPTDFFESITPGCDAYLIKHTLHNWNDDKAVAILSRIREAIGDNRDARLFVIDMLLTEHGKWDIGKLVDVEMLIILGGRERGREEWNRIARAAGFEPSNDPTPGDLVLLEFRPV